MIEQSDSTAYLYNNTLQYLMAMTIRRHDGIHLTAAERYVIIMITKQIILEFLYANVRMYAYYYYDDINKTATYVIRYRIIENTVQLFHTNCNAKRNSRERIRIETAVFFPVSNRKYTKILYAF